MSSLWNYGLNGVLLLVTVIGVFVMVSHVKTNTGQFFGEQLGPYGQLPWSEYHVSAEIPYDKLIIPKVMPKGTEYACCNAAILAQYTNRCPLNPLVFERACASPEIETYYRYPPCYQGELLCPKP